MVITLRQRVMLASAGLLLLTCAPLALWLPARLDALSLKWLESRATGIAKALVGSASAAIARDDRELVRAELGALARTPDAVYGEIVAPDGRSVAAWGRIPAQKPPLTTAAPVRYDDGLLHVAVAAEAQPGARATLLAGFSLAEYKAGGRQTRILVGSIATSIFAFGLLGAWMLGTVLVRPLGRVTEVAQRIAAGDEAAAVELPIQSRDEVGRMAGALAQTFEELRRQRARVAEMNAELAVVVEDRTGELVRTNVALADLRIAQEQLVVADRRSTLGRLAAGVGHEINNPLAYVIGNVDWVREELKAEQAALARAGKVTTEDEDRLDAMGAALFDASEGALRIKEIVAQLRTFSRGGADELNVPVRLTDALDVALALLGHEIRHRARLKRVDLGAPPVRASLVQLSQVFVNLLVNAAHAIPEGAPDRHEIRTTVGTDPQGRAYVEIQDTGCGMSKQQLIQLFTPFFTTKPVGQGTGLGLSVSLGIVRSYCGEITVESEPGVGSKFRVVLPPCADSPSASAAEPPADVPLLSIAAHLSARVLVVDDEPPIADVLVRHLGRQHQPTSAASGREALQRIERGERYDVILCDLMMPEMNGMELYAALTSAAPDQAARMIFITGGAYTEAGRRFLEVMEGRWLEKPIDLEKLDRLVRARLA